LGSAARCKLSSPTTRFLDALEVDMVAGGNTARVDLFDSPHARKVLADLGRAFGRLTAGALRRDEESFVAQAVSGLAEGGRVVPVRLALFAEMMKSRPWTEAALREAGGAEGVGVAFLEESFSSRSAQPRCRLHQKAARTVLRALLPEAGADIKGGMRSRNELLEASGYAERPRDFEDLLRILDGELRLLTPADPEASLEEGGAPGPAAPGQHYQLTHDYLVPSLREWLERKQKETARGRAELKLAERAALWSARPESRFLPAWWEYLGIRLLTRRQSWTESQLKLMRRAGRFHGVRGTALGVLLAALTWVGLTIRDQVIETGRASHAAALVARLVYATEAQVPAVIEELEDYRPWADPLLREKRASAPAGSREELHTALGLLPADPGQVPFLIEALLAASPERFTVVRDALRPHAAGVAARLWKLLGEPRKAGDGDARFRAACALAAYDPGGAWWESVSAEAAERLVAQNSLVVSAWAEALRPVRRRLLGPLAAVFRGSARPETERAVAVDVLADYAADDPAVLADLLLDADAKAFQVLFAKIEPHGERAAAPLEAEIERELRPQWSDSPLDASWKEPEAAAVHSIEVAQGLVAQRFALCQTMPLADFSSVVDSLRVAGFRLRRMRPYVAAGAVQVAAFWDRDGRESRWAAGLTVQDLHKRDEELRAQGFGPEDVLGYVREGRDLYAALWLKGPSGAATSKLEAGLEEEPSGTDSFVLSVHSRFTDSDGKDRHSAVWVATEGQAQGETFSFSGFEPEYSGEMYPGELQVDVQVRKAPPRRRAKERFQRDLEEVEAKLKEEPEDLDLRFQRGVARFELGETEAALEDLSWVIEKEAVAKDPRDGELRFYAARACALASGALLGKDPAEARRRADRAVDLLKGAVEAGELRFERIEGEPDLDPLREHPGLQALWSAAKPERRYAALWRMSATLTSTELQGLDPAAHLAGARRLAAGGWRPASLSAAEVQPGVVATASVWHLPVVPDAEKDALAKRKASAAAALLRLGRPAKAWPLFRHSPDPSVRSYLVHRVKPLAVKPEALIARLKEETEVSSRRALLLALGEFPASEVTAETREKLVAEVLALFRDDPDPGLHGAAEWLLRRWGAAEKVREVEKALATGKVEGERRWFLTKQGQTFVVVEGPVEFLMGSPGSEAERNPDEVLHKRRIGRSFAIVAKEVTVAEFKRFQPGFGHSHMHRAPALDCPILGVTWYEAAAYCNWLSKEEGLPESEWCYLPIAEGGSAQGMKLAPRYLERRGYRLPSEAEWEYAARAGALTSRSYGRSLDLLGAYAWYSQTSSERSWPAGTLKPNDLGLFDTLGNIAEWCQGRFVRYPVGVGGKSVDDSEDRSDVVSDNRGRLFRGGAFPGPSVGRALGLPHRQPADGPQLHVRSAAGEDLPLTLSPSYPFPLAPRLHSARSPRTHPSSSLLSGGGGGGFE
jgi:formylglycine-generating enzyme required for sulfatase activity